MYVHYIKLFKTPTYSEKNGKICQNIKRPTPTHIPSSVQLSTWGKLED